jgi:hypothetical protein
LLEQCNARTKGKSFTYDEINSDFLRHKKTASLKLSISGGVAQNLQYLIKLVNAVIDYDISKERYSPEALVADASRMAVARRLSAFDQQFLCAKSLSLWDVELQEERQIATHLDDPVLIAYESKYIGKVFLDERALYKIFKISIITKKDREIGKLHA